MTLEIALEPLCAAYGAANARARAVPSPLPRCHRSPCLSLAAWATVHSNNKRKDHFHSYSLYSVLHLRQEGPAGSLE